MRQRPRNVPEGVDPALRKKAVRRNQVILDSPMAGMTGARTRADFNDVAGKWTPDPAFDEIVAGQRRIDPEQWK